jgi:prepilin-type N-terminal cleavage/methylation domain-containing protein
VRPEGRCASFPGAGPPTGFSLVEVLACLALLGILIAVAVPLLAETVARERLRAAGWETALLLRGLRHRAIAERLAYGLRFIQVAGLWSCSLYRDGNGNGIRTADILAGRDPLVWGPEDPGTRHEGIRYGLPDAAVPQIPPATGLIQNPADPVKFGASDIVSFSPSGSISSGTLYLTDGRRVTAVVAYGPTGRIRVFRFDPASGWRQAP